MSAVAWMRGHVTPGTHHGPAEYDVEFCFGNDCPAEGWVPLYASPQKPQPSPGLAQVIEAVISEYKAHYSFPWQGESHMRDVLTDVLERFA